jgi:hypothetical protein
LLVPGVAVHATGVRSRQGRRRSKGAFRNLAASKLPPGILPYEDGEAVRWCSVGPRELFVRLDAVGGKLWPRGVQRGGAALEEQADDALRNPVCHVVRWASLWKIRSESSGGEGVNWRYRSLGHRRIAMGQMRTAPERAFSPRSRRRIQGWRRTVSTRMLCPSQSASGVGESRTPCRPSG